MDQRVKVDSHQNQMGDRRPPGTKERSFACFEVKLATSLGSIQGRVTIYTGPMGLVDLVPTAYELTNILVHRSVKREEEAGRLISCRSQCGVCCRQMVPLSPPEAFYLPDLIDSLDSDLRKELFRLFDVITGQLRYHDMINELLRPEYSDDPALAIARQYFQFQLDCPFLVDQSCSIYPHRPVACREYNVTSPAAWCADPYAHDIAKVPMPLPLSAPLARLTARLTGSEPRLIPLTLVLLWVAEHDDLRQRKWPGLQLFKEFMDEVGKSPQPNKR